MGCHAMPVVRAACGSCRVLSRQYARDQYWTAETAELGSVEGQWVAQQEDGDFWRVHVLITDWGWWDTSTCSLLSVFMQRERFHQTLIGVPTAKGIKLLFLNRFKLIKYLRLKVNSDWAISFFVFFLAGFCQLVVKQYLNRVSPRLQPSAKLRASSYSLPSSCFNWKGWLNTFTLKSCARDVNHCGNDWIVNLIIVNVIIWLQTCEAHFNFMRNSIKWEVILAKVLEQQL